MRAKTLKGLKGNLRFITVYKTWSTLTVFAIGLAVGMAGLALWVI